MGKTPRMRGKKALYAAWELFFPATCVGCGVGGTALLDAAGTRRALCTRCETSLRKQTSAVHTPVLQHPVPGAVAAGIYEKTLAHVILSMKNAGRTDAVPELARGLGRAVATIIDRAQVPAGTRILLIPVPSSQRSVQRRGYVPAELLVRQVEHELNRSVALHRRKVRVKTHHILSLEKENIYQRLIRPNTAGQKTLGASARAQRMEGAMRVSPRASVAGALCIVCDDVMTTGATVSEASRALRQAGARVLGTACVAAVSMQKKVDEEALMVHPD